MKEEKYIWSKKNHSLFETYAEELQAFWEEGNKVESGSRMLQVSLEKQRAYMDKHDLHMTYEMIPNGHFAKEGVEIGWKDDVYSNTVECRSCSMTRRIFHGKEKVYQKTENIDLYLTITNVLNKTLLSKKQYNCPNCGALSTVEQLENMCPFCQTRFKMSDLFPKVTNFYTVKAYGGTKKEVNATVWKYCLPFILIGMVFLSVYYNVTKVDSTNVLANCISGIIFGGIFGAIVGYVVFAISTIGSATKDAGKSLPMLFSLRGSKKRFVNTVKQYSPEFSYEYFSNKVVSILRQLLSEENIEENPYYIGESTDIDGTSIVEYAFRGVVGLKKCKMHGSQCHVVTDVFMTDYYWKNNHIRKRDEVFRIALTKDLSKKIDYPFTLSAIQCKNCGASFDATRGKTCPFCGTGYQIEDDDWVVTAIQKK